VRKYGVTPSDEIAGLLAEGGFTPEEVIVTGTRSMSRCLSWQAIAYLEGIMGKNRGKAAVSIDYDRLPTGPDDTDPDKIAYAQSIQSQFLRRDQLKKYGTIEP
ncbi:MAG TPA: hypothetical protein VJM32_03745, partial [Candidatus Saccharimonadales bacterium]|nr:hypothetical protein [Candidatus Saccharimonadales bacterium]